MADFLTHELFGKMTETKAPDEVQEAAKKYPEAFSWGFQGPDLLFFRKYWVDFGPFHKLGNRMHSELTDELFESMSKFIRWQKGEKREILLSYFYGFLCHYALDSEIHPYVYALQKKGTAKKSDIKGSFLHGQIETDIDMMLYDRMEGKAAQNYHPYAGHHLPDGQKWMIGELYETAALEVYGEVLPAEEIFYAFSDMLLIEDVLFRRGGNLEKIAHAAGLIKPDLGDFVSHAKIRLPSWDALNLKKRGWRNPDQPEVLRHESVPEILSLACSKAVWLMEQYVQIFNTDCWKVIHYPVSFDNGNSCPQK